MSSPVQFLMRNPLMALGVSLTGMMALMVLTSPKAIGFEASTAGKPLTSKQSARRPSPKAPTGKVKTPKKPSAAARSLKGGIAAAKTGKYQTAVVKLSAAIKAGELGLKDTARALMYRGIAYRNLNKPSLAIADLSGALWKKTALSPSERALASQERAAVVAGKQPAASRSQRAGPAIAGRPGAPQRARRTTSGSWATKSRVAAKPRTVRIGNKVYTVPKGSTPKKRAGAGWQTGQATPAAKPSKKTARTNAVRRRAGKQRSRQTGWKTRAGKVRRADKKVVAARRVGRKVGKKRQAVKLRGTYRVQIAALRNRADAVALAQRVRLKHKGVLSSRSPRVEKGIMGNIGTMYQVRVGPFRSAAATKKLCARLRSDGLDCFLIGPRR